MEIIKKIQLFFCLMYCFCISGIAQDQIELPTPTGRYQVASKSYFLLDSSRVDTIENVAYQFSKTGKVDTLQSNQISAYRKIGIRIWYPAQIDKKAKKAKKASYFPYLTARENKPDFYEQATRYYQRIMTNTYQTGSIIETKKALPIILFSTGRGTGISFYTSIAEEMASHGYIFVGISSNHATNIGFPDFYLPALQRWRPDLSIYDAAFEKADQFFYTPNHIISGDILFVIEQLTRMNETDEKFKNKLNLNKIGFMGHSMGGMAASLACLKSEKCKAFFSIEAASSKEVRVEGLEVPSGLLMSDFSLSLEENKYRPIYLPKRKNKKADFHLFRIDKAGHNSFMDLPLVAPTQFSYELKPRVGINIIRKTSLAFFNKYLYGQTYDLSILI